MTAEDWLVASESAKDLRSKAVMPGRLLRAAGQIVRVPDGKIHAYEDGETHTACGIEVESLWTWRDEGTTWANMVGERCLECRSAVAKD